MGSTLLVVVEIGEAGVNGLNRGFFVVGVVDAAVGEDVQGVLPVRAGLLGFVQGAVGVGESVVGARLVVGVAQRGGEGEGPPVVGKCGLRVAGGVLYPAQALLRIAQPDRNACASAE